MKISKTTFYSLHVGVINPIVNILPFFWINVFYDNQSFIGNELGHRIYLLFWSISSAYGFYLYSKKIWDRYKISYHPIFHSLICFFMFISCLIPYAANLPFWINDLHVWIAIISVFLFILEWLVIYFKPIYFLKENFRKYLHVLTLDFSVCAIVLFSIGHVTAISEILFSVTVNILLVIGIKN